MATLIDANKVNYQCSCKRLKPLSCLYFCKYCEWLTLKCKDCVFHEIDQKYYCPNCFDNKVLKEVMALKYKCSNCYSCPSCKNLLMIRASTAKNKEAIAAAAAAAAAAAEAAKASPSTTTEGAAATPAQQPPTQLPKVFYLMCGFCRWSTRDAGIPDALSTPGGWKLHDNPNIKRIKELTDAYQIIAQREKLEKERKRYATTKSGRRFHLSSAAATAAVSGTNVNAISGSGFVSSAASSLLSADKFGVLGPFHKRQTAATSAGGAKIDLQTPFDEYLRSLVRPGETVESFEPLSSDLFTKEVNISTITSIQQRHANPDFQPTRFNELYPLNKYYMSKESKRCTGCEHNVLKPESNITSIKFKLHQMALFSVPEVRIVTIPEWNLKEPNVVILSVTNRCEFDVNISFAPLSTVESSSENKENQQQSDNFGLNTTIEFGDEKSGVTPSTTIKVDRQDNAKSQVPAALVQADLDTNGFVCFRRDNKIGISVRIKLVDSEGASRRGENVKCAFEMTFSNANAASTTTAATTATTAAPSVTTEPTTSPTAAATATSSAVSSPVTSSTSNQAATNSPQTLRVFLDFGPLTIQNGLKPVSIPKYIEDCLNKKQ